MLKNRNLAIIALIAVVNALGYGIIIPVLYSYSKKFGMSDLQNGLLFSIFSLFQFLSTPIIGRLSDKYGRKPLLVISLAGTALSFLIMAFAPSSIFLFLARALDGLTAGNIPVASAVISDTTAPADRAKGFGMIGASFGFGFVFGPAISALTVGISDQIPFIIAALISLVAVILTALFLPETNKHMGEVKQGKLFDPLKLIQAVTDQKVGITLFISLVYSLAFGMFIFVFQPFSIKVMHLTTQTISAIFTLYGVVGLLSQIFILPRLNKLLGENKALKFTFLLSAINFFAFFLVKDFFIFLLISVFMGFSNSVINPLVQTILSKATDEKSQGSIQGINASYFSIGLILGPIIGGTLASFSVPLPFLLGSLLFLGCLVLSFKIPSSLHNKEHAF